MGPHPSRRSPPSSRTSPVIPGSRSAAQTNWDRQQVVRLRQIPALRAMLRMDVAAGIDGCREGSARSTTIDGKSPGTEGEQHQQAAGDGEVLLEVEDLVAV